MRLDVYLTSLTTKPATTTLSDDEIADHNDEIRKPFVSQITPRGVFDLTFSDDRLIETAADNLSS